MTDETMETPNGTVAVEAEAEASAKPMADLGRQALKMAEQARKEAAKGLQKAADKVREEVRSGDDQDEEAIERADQLAGGLERAAFYLKDTSVTEMGEQIEERVKAQPYQALLIALLVGVVFGFLLPKPWNR